MSNVILENINIASSRILPAPEVVKGKLPLPEGIAGEVAAHRKTVESIIAGTDKRPLVVMGPCSIHDPLSAIEYAGRLAKLAKEVESKIFIIMRVYFEKPRTTTGWKGLINDPQLNDSCHVEEGLMLARKIMLEIAGLGLPIATESLDPIMPQYLGDLVSWTAIGARTTESQTHRELASGLSVPVGFKNGTDGSIAIAVNAIKSAAAQHSFLGINQKGEVSIFNTRGNKYGHLVLRGGAQPNYDEASVALAVAQLKKAGVCERVIVDCSHGNSSKDYKRQPAVFDEALRQIKQQRNPIIGFMLESHLESGRQDLGANPAELKYGVSITDACIDWETSAALIRKAAGEP